MQELERKLAELEMAYARNKLLQVPEQPADGGAQLQGSGGIGAGAPPPLEFGELAADALQLAQQVNTLADSKAPPHCRITGGDVVTMQ